MTKHPQQEYIITENDCVIMEEWGKFPKYWIKYLRSRPAPPVPVWTDEQVMKEIEEAFDRGIAAAEATIDMQRHDESIREEAVKTERERVLDKMFPNNTVVNSNGDLEGGWELDPKPLFKLAKEMRADPQCYEEPNAEVIESVVLAIKKSLRSEQEKP